MADGIGQFDPEASTNGSESSGGGGGGADGEGQSTDSDADGEGQSTDSDAPDSADQGCEEQARRPCSQDDQGAHVAFPKGRPVGACQYGEQVCEGGEWQACKGLIAPKSKDLCNISGDDSNCNGTPNEGCDCLDSAASRPCGVSDIGICKLGVQSCENGSWSECKGDIAPKTERCDNKGIDEDCDGDIDLADEDCYCVDGEQELCTLNQKGDCNLGIRTCGHGAWGECIPRFPKMENESCHAPRTDAHGSAVGDEDCDGEVDNTLRNGKDPIGCKVYMVDEDKDGWGAFGFDYNMNLDTYTYGCFCVGHVPNPSMVQDTKFQANRDCGDCAEGGDVVIPDSKDTHTKPSACLKEVGWSGGEFDYNCDGTEQLARPTLGKCVEKAGVCSEVHGSWLGSVPACGQEGRLSDRCVSSTPPCELTPTLELEIQECN